MVALHQIGFILVAVFSASVMLYATTALAAPSDDAASEAGPTEVVEAFHASLIRVMMTPGLEERQALLEPVVASSFDLGTIGRISLGRSWRKMEDEARRDFSDLMKKLIVANYASRFGKYDGQEFSIREVKDLRRGRKQVRTQLTTSQDTVSLDYQLDNTDEGWRIYDVVANGVSDLSLKKSSYTALHKKGGLEAVIASVQENISKSLASYRD